MPAIKNGHFAIFASMGAGYFFGSVGSLLFGTGLVCSFIEEITKPQNLSDILTPVNLQEAAKDKIDESFAKVKIIPKYKTKWELHHIVAKKAWRAEPARAVLQSAGLTPEYDRNLIYLKTGLHRRLHNTLYYEWINYEMESISVMFDEGALKENQAKIDLKLDEIRVVLEGWNASEPF